MTDADKIMHPQHFGTDTTNIRIRIQINPKIRIRNPRSLFGVSEGLRCLSAPRCSFAGCYLLTSAVQPTGLLAVSVKLFFHAHRRRLAVVVALLRRPITTAGSELHSFIL